MVIILVILLKDHLVDPCVSKKLHDRLPLAKLCLLPLVDVGLADGFGAGSLSLHRFKSVNTLVKLLGVFEVYLVAVVHLKSCSIDLRDKSLQSLG